MRWKVLLAGYLAALGAGFALALALAAAGDWNEGLEWERALLFRLRDIALPASADTALLVAPWLGTNWTTLPIAVALSLYFIWKRRMDLALPLLVIQAGSNTLNAILKHAAWRERPELWERRGQFAWPSYPSGHAIATMSVLLFLTILLVRERGVKWTGLVVAPIVLLVLYSRVYLGVHWPTDVIGGVLVGLIWLATVLRAFPLPQREVAGEIRAEEPIVAA